MNEKLAGYLNRLPEVWFVSDKDRAAALCKELQREIPPGHLLHNRQVEIVAHREDTDDILCHHIEEPYRFTVIHLSWVRRQEIDEKYPHVEVDGTFDDFLRYENTFSER